VIDAFLRSTVLGKVFIETEMTPERAFVEKLKRSLKYDGVVGTAGEALTNIVE
jgi:hypothetical protein